MQAGTRRFRKHWTMHISHDVALYSNVVYADLFEWLFMIRWSLTDHGNFMEQSYIIVARVSLACFFIRRPRDKI